MGVDEARKDEGVPISEDLIGLFFGQDFPIFADPDDPAVPDEERPARYDPVRVDDEVFPGKRFS